MFIVPETHYAAAQASNVMYLSVEHGFGFIQRNWMKNSFHLASPSGLSPVAAYFIAAVLLSNGMTCFRGNQISERFQCKAPSLEKYFQFSQTEAGEDSSDSSGEDIEDDENNEEGEDSEGS